MIPTKKFKSFDSMGNSFCKEEFVIVGGEHSVKNAGTAEETLKIFSPIPVHSGIHGDLFAFYESECGDDEEVRVNVLDTLDCCKCIECRKAFRKLFYCCCCDRHKKDIDLVYKKHLTQFIPEKVTCDCECRHYMRMFLRQENAPFIHKMFGWHLHEQEFVKNMKIG